MQRTFEWIVASTYITFADEDDEVYEWGFINRDEVPACHQCALNANCTGVYEFLQGMHAGGRREVVVST